MKPVCEPCPLCGQKMRLREGPYGRFWWCSGHPECPTTRRARDDGSPVGPFNTADAATRQWRQQAHAVFDPLWQGGGMPRDTAYAWLARTMRLPVQEAHIGRFTIVQCRKLIGLVRLGVGLPKSAGRE